MLRQMACKPGSVLRCRRDGHSSGTSVAGRLARPTRTAARKRVNCRPYLVLLPVGLALPSPLPEARCALTAPFQPCRGFRPVGGVISVALSLESPPPDVIRHRVPVEPGLSSRGRSLQRPSGHLTPPKYKSSFAKLRFQKNSRAPLDEPGGRSPSPLISEQERPDGRVRENPRAFRGFSFE